LDDVLPNGVVDSGNDGKEIAIVMRTSSPSQSPARDAHSYMPDANGADSLKTKIELVDESLPADPEKAPEVKNSPPEPPPPPLNGSSDTRGTSANGSTMSLPPTPRRQEDGEIRGISPPKQSSFVPRAHTPPTQPRSFNSIASPGPVSTLTPAPPSLPRRPSQAQIARPSAGLLARPLPSGPRALRAANAHNLLPGVPRGPSADRERVDWDRDRSWPARARGRGAGWGR
jgi:hypothetical protein